MRCVECQANRILQRSKEVDKSQNKKWIFRFTLNQKRRDMGLGRFPDIGLREARNRRDEARKLVAQGQDPITARR